MKILIRVIGKIKEKYFCDAILDYKKRIGKYTTIKIEEFKEGKSIDSETETLISGLKTTDNIILLDINGRSYSSIEFSNILKKAMISKRVVFIIGGSMGVNKEILRSKNIISFSKLTFPHQMFRVILLEQIYRAFKIIKNEPYHK